MDTSVRITYPNKEPVEYSSIEEASNETEITVETIKRRCNSNKVTKDGIKCEWLDEHTKRHFLGKKSKQKGKSLEYRIRDKLIDIGYTGARRSAGESRTLDADKVDIADINNELPIAIQAKRTSNTPNYFGIRDSSTDKRPFCLCWQSEKVGDIVYFVPEDFFYTLLDTYTKYNHILDNVHICNKDKECTDKDSDN